MVILLCHEFFGVLLAVQNYGNVPETATATEVSFTDPDEIEMGNSEQLGENIIHDQKMEGGSSKKEQSAGIKRGGKIQKINCS